VVDELPVVVERLVFLLVEEFEGDLFICEAPEMVRHAFLDGDLEAEDGGGGGVPWDCVEWTHEVALSHSLRL
jgi:hypothetical protein